VGLYVDQLKTAANGGVSVDFCVNAQLYAQVLVAIGSIVQDTL
jgi:hypothetical protein